MNGRLGVVGGMGPLVSAEFVKTIYEYSIHGREQDSPRVLLYSDPTFPDRTSAILAGREQTLVRPLADAIECLDRAGAEQIVICCITVHQVLAALPAALGGRVRSLLDVIVEEVAASATRHLLLASSGTRKAGLFERHPGWTAIADRVVLPDSGDQDKIHEAIYRLKGNEDVAAVMPLIDRLMRKYRIESFIAGCTEMHFIAKRVAAERRDGAPRFVDPLLTIARGLAQGV